MNKAREALIKSSLRYLLEKGEDAANLSRLFPEYSHYISEHSQQNNGTILAFPERSLYSSNLTEKQLA